MERGAPTERAERRGWLDGGAGVPAFASLHPGASAPGGTAVLVVPPFGWDDMCSYRARRALAERLAERGVSALRLDLPGGGDAAGDPSTPGLVAAWLDAVAAGAALLRTSEGAARVVAVGLGLGGLLAHHAAAAGAAIDDLALWATPARGRAAVRELEALGRLEGGLLPDPDPVEGAVLAAGYPLAPATVADVRAIDLSREELPAAAGRRALLLGRDGTAPDERLAEALRAAGVDVATHPGEGWGRMMAEPQFSVVPDATLDALVAFATAPGLPASPLAAPAAPRWSSSLPLEAGASERPTSFAGPSAPLPAIVAEPAGRPLLDVVWLNAGPQRRIGPNRLWVRTARRWAARGVRVVRVDLAGIGDAPSWRDYREVRALYSGEHQAEARAVLDALRGEDHGPLVLGGLCSGANWAANVAVDEPDVAGVLLLNPITFAFDQRRLELTDARFMVRQLAAPATWRKVVRGQVNWRRPLRLVRAVVLHVLGRLRRDDAAQAAVDDPTSREEEVLRALADGGRHVALVFSGAEQLQGTLAAGEALGSLVAAGRVDVHAVGSPEVETHTLRPLAVQREVERVLDAELERLLAAASAR